MKKNQRPALDGPVVDVQDLQFSYGKHHAVRGVTLTIEPAQVYALLGTNGAGKTTTLELIQGFRAPTSGSVRVLGVEPTSNQGAIRARTGVMLQEAGFFTELSVLSTLRLWSDLSSRRDDVDTVLQRVGLDHKADTRVQALSGGERRRLDLATAIWGGPDLIVLDEPTTGLDPFSRQTLWTLVRELRAEGTTVLLTTHQLEEAESLADRVAIMNQGRIAVAGTLDEVLSTQPARITFDVVPAVGTEWLDRHRRPGGVEISVDRVTRPHGERLELRVSGPEPVRDLRWLLDVADRERVDLERLRANPASLEEVFHQVRLTDLDDVAADPDSTSAINSHEVSS
ncbi:ABC transporter ATP-binding protein [Yimella sp. cx-51]|uniref:ABC transporter ATP-binding protein n=1 Tax=Yimella sp. cx-51 TaxID=2770551 RepID=UPI00165D5FA2|nr:ABC transporter ATP-binding protein [Yimella sp. cx-51]MBC9956543.1 ABC transporter ATP-binding protein [Yimella sp. cx-51]MBD2760393.1 ABC transporter ATP-binding protein [Yimella sp. cx-573]QTH38353.1 ABC transporter ATP-binding protein [Yimella sp. cx-51]